MKKILITGAGGFVGKRLTAKLAELGHDIFALIKKKPYGDDKSFFKHYSIKTISYDLKNFKVNRLPSEIDTIFTLAQHSDFRDFPSEAVSTFQVNTSANLSILKWAVEKKVKRFIHASSGGIYGGKKEKVLVETDSLNVDRQLGFYLSSKLCSEILFQNFFDFFESSIILRPFFIYGPGQKSDMFIARLIRSIEESRGIELKGRNGLKVNPIFVDDAVDAFASSLDLIGNHTINLAGPDILSLKEIVELLGRLLGKKPLYNYEEGEPTNYVADIRRFKSLLIGELTSFEDGIKKTLYLKK